MGKREVEPCGGCARLVPINERTITTAGLRCSTCQRVGVQKARRRGALLARLDRLGRGVVETSALLRSIEEREQP